MFKHDPAHATDVGDSCADDWAMPTPSERLLVNPSVGVLGVDDSGVHLLRLHVSLIKSGASIRDETRLRNTRHAAGSSVQRLEVRGTSGARGGKLAADVKLELVPVVYEARKCLKGWAP